MIIDGLIARDLAGLIMEILNGPIAQGLVGLITEILNGLIARDLAGLITEVLNGLTVLSVGPMVVPVPISDVCFNVSSYVFCCLDIWKSSCSIRYSQLLCFRKGFERDKDFV